MRAVMLRVLLALATGQSALYAASPSLTKPVLIPTQAVGARAGQIDAQAAAETERAFRFDMQKPPMSFRVLALNRNQDARNAGNPKVMAVPTIAADVFNQRRQTAQIDAARPEWPGGADTPEPSRAMVPSGTAPPSSDSRSACSAMRYRPAGFLDWPTERRRAAHYALVSMAACQHDLPVELLDALIIRESRYDPAASSSRDAFGLAQLKAGTAADLHVDRYIAQENLAGGARYLRRQLDRFGSVPLALAAYNAGPGKVIGGAFPHIPETWAYVRDIMLTWRSLVSDLDAGTARPLASPNGDIAVAKPDRPARMATVLSF